MYFSSPPPMNLSYRDIFPESPNRVQITAGLEYANFKTPAEGWEITFAFAIWLFFQLFEKIHASVFF